MLFKVFQGVKLEGGSQTTSSIKFCYPNHAFLSLYHQLHTGSHREEAGRKKKGYRMYQEDARPVSTKQHILTRPSGRLLGGPFLAAVKRSFAERPVLHDPFYTSVAATVDGLKNKASS